jgi:hypothetical protein
MRIVTASPNPSKGRGVQKRIKHISLLTPLSSLHYIIYTPR